LPLYRQDMKSRIDFIVLVKMTNSHEYYIFDI